MDYHSYYAKAGKPVETCIVGTGGFGQSFLAQVQRVPLLSGRIAVDVSAESAVAGFLASGIEPRRVRICNTAREAKAAWEMGDYIAASDLATVSDLPFDVVIEATGRPLAAARHAMLAIEADKHIALVTKELDSVVGPGLKKLAADRGRVVTTVDGDQPSLLIGLISWAEVLGFDLIAAGKSSEYDFVYDFATGNLRSNENSAHCSALATHWTLGDRDVEEIVAARRAATVAFPQRAIPDLCELMVVANAMGLQPDRPDLHAPSPASARCRRFFLIARTAASSRGSAGSTCSIACVRPTRSVSPAGSSW